jgi:hypothetical protein
MKYTKEYITQVHNILKQQTNPIFRLIPKSIVHIIIMYFINNICHSILKGKYTYIKGHFTIYPDSYTHNTTLIKSKRKD